jgi:DNA-binding SARP family transcriptional activator/tetratricopeptide (TPR) repeat protein
LAPHLHLLTLGAPLLLTPAGEQVRFRTRKHFALLIRLAVEAGRKLTRDYLMELLWPGVAAPRARHSLAQALTVLKEKVGREHLVVQRTSIALVAEAVHADVTRLDAPATEIRGPFLDGFDVPGAVQFEQWKDEWRARLMPRIRDCLVKQMDGGRRIGDFETVERHAQMLLELDPLSEDGVRGVMEARAWVGDRSNALKAYNRFEARLAEELGAKPSSDLERIANLLREGRRSVARPASAGQVSERQERRFEAETLIGREREFARLYDAWLQVRRREPRIVVLLGDPGVGKTTLTNAFVSTCQMEGASIARAQAYDAERELPFGVLAELIKQLTLQRAIGGADPEALSELTRIAPEIFRVFPGVPKPAEWAAEVVPLRLADSFLKAVEAAAEESPLALVVDDIHAADNATVAILHTVARKLPSTRLLIILTARSNELRTTTAASGLATDGTIQALQTLDVEPLSDEAAERLVTTRVAKSEGRIADVPVSRILRAGSGNPLALELLTKEWLAHGSGSLLGDLEALNTQPAASIGIPRAIGAVFDRQIRRLDRVTRAALDLAAVLGRRLADFPLYQVVELSPATAGEALSRLRDEGLLREVQGSLEFRNELLRAQAYYAVAGPARQHLHLQVGAILAAAGDENGRASKLEVAWHYLRGGEPGKAVTHAIEGARAAIKVGAPLEAEEILALILRQPSAERSMQDIRLLLAKALVAQSKAARAAPLLQLIAQDGNLSSEDNADASRMEATVQYLLNREPGPSYCEAADRALVAARKTGSMDLVAKALFECARSGVNAGDELRVGRVREETNRAMDRGAQELSPMLLYTKAYCDFFFYDLCAATTELEAAIRLLRERHDPVDLSLAYTGYGTCKHGLCEFDEACESFLKALELSQRIGDDTRAALIASNICASKLHEGHYKSAVKFGELAVRHGTSALSARLANTHVNLAMALLMAGCREEATRALDSALKFSQGESSWVATMEVLLGHATIALLLGDKTLALELIRSAEHLAAGKERAIPNSPLFERLCVFRTVHTSGPAGAERIVVEGKEKYRGRYPFAYIQMIACGAWLDLLNFGHYTEENERELGLFEKLHAAGLREILTLEGFLQGPTPEQRR